MRYGNIVDAVGNTPVVRLNRLAPSGIDLFVKLESMNPGGSIKDRLAAGVIAEAERTGKLRPGQTVVEATSGNTGIGLAMVCAQRGYPLVIVMAENFSIERRKLMRFLGAKVVLTPAAEKGTGMLAKAVELAEKHGWFLTRQFDNEANADIHSETTAREILRDFADRPLDYWVTGFGTGGTLKGVARVLKRETPRTKIVVCEPDNSQMYASGIRGTFAPTGVPLASHPVFRPHLVQGWSPDFVPKLADDAREWVDEIIPIDSAEALRFSRELATKEGILAGISAGATLAASVTLCKRLPAGSTVLCMLPDTGERYQSTPLFEGIAAEMSAEELEISRSTPHFRFDVPLSIAVEDSGEPASRPTEAARAFVTDVVGDATQPVVMFALTWCEFSWAVRKLFSRCGVRFRSVDLDSAEYRAGDWGGAVRAALTERTSSRTIPQVFVGGTLVGGTTEVFRAFSQGRIQTMLADAGVPFEDKVGDELYSLLPRWARRADAT